MIKALFLDRDGVVNNTVKRFNEEYKKYIDDSPFNCSELNFNSEIKDVLNYGIKKRYMPIIITNQPSIIKGNMNMKDYEDITSNICNFLNISRSQIFECFHKESLSMECQCRKPKPGLFLMAKGLFDIDLGKSIMVGDSYRDLIAANSAGVYKKVYLTRSKDKNQIGNIEDKLYMMKKNNAFPVITINYLNEIISKEII